MLISVYMDLEEAYIIVDLEGWAMEKTYKLD